MLYDEEELLVVEVLLELDVKLETIELLEELIGTIFVNLETLFEFEIILDLIIDIVFLSLQILCQSVLRVVRLFQA
jgi:hypothetical protein